MALHIAGPAGTLEALLDLPAGADEPGTRPRAAVVFAHPHPQHGGTMHTKVVYQGAKALARTGCAVLRFNFRGVGSSQGVFDDRFPGLPIWAAGFSFGAWVALECGAVDDRVTVLIAIAPPVARESYDFSGVLQSAKPKFLIQGDLDQVCPLREARAFYAWLPEPRELVVIDGASHLFDGRTLEVGDALEDLAGDFEA
jgi:alpha/beta superfamily hydrolase